MQIQPLLSEHAAIVYLDFKSPYAYLAIEPTRQLEKELGIQFDWRPFVLDIPSYLGSAKLGHDGQVLEQSRTVEQWAAVKYAYYDCRRYANIGGLTIRGTTKIWNTHLAATAMLWIRETAVEQIPTFIDAIYTPFWRRELDIESTKEVAHVLINCGLSPTEFEEWRETIGEKLNKQFQEQCFADGIYGVPTYVVDNELFFGREHLPRIAWLLEDKKEPAPDIANWLVEKPKIQKTSDTEIYIGIDDSYDSLLAIPKIHSLLKEKGVKGAWHRVTSCEMSDLMPQEDSNQRSAMHRRYREQNEKDNRERYAPNLEAAELPALIEQALREYKIKLRDSAPEEIQTSPFPGVSVHLNSEQLIGRQHLPLISRLLE